MEQEIKELELLRQDYKERQAIKSNKFKPLKKIFRNCRHCKYSESADYCKIKQRYLIVFEEWFCKYYEVE